MVECINPEGYPDVWKYNIWLEGQWNNLANVTKCMDPNVCYNDPPALPKDFSVEWNQTLAKPNAINTTLNYTCGRKCEPILLSFHEFLHWVLNFKTKSRIFVSKESLDQGFLHPWVEGAMGAPSSQKHTKNYSLLKTNCFAPLIRGSNASPWGHTLTDKTFEGLSISRHNCSIYWRFLAQPLFVLSGQHA